MGRPPKVNNIIENIDELLEEKIKVSYYHHGEKEFMIREFDNLDSALNFIDNPANHWHDGIDGMVVPSIVK